MACPAPFAKIFLFSPDANQFTESRRPVPQRGVSRSSRTRGGMRWTRQRARRTRPEADGEVVSFWHPDAGVKLAEATPLTTVSIKRGHRGEHEISRKTIARGMPVESVCPVVTMLVCFVLFRTRGCGCSERPAFPAPSVSLGERFMHDSDASRRGIADAYLKRRIRHVQP